MNLPKILKYFSFLVFIIITCWTFGLIKLGIYSNLTRYCLRIGSLTICTPFYDYRGLIPFILFCIFYKSKFKAIFDKVIYYFDRLTLDKKYLE
jgi:hypothetical protein